MAEETETTEVDDTPVENTIAEDDKEVYNPDLYRETPFPPPVLTEDPDED